MNSNNESAEFFVSRLDADLLEAWEERAAFMEFDSGMSRDLAGSL